MPEYAAYGLTIRSEIALPPLQPAVATGPAVNITAGHVPEAVPQAHTYRNWCAVPGRFTIRVGNTCRIQVKGGDTIVVDGAETIDSGQLVSMILGSGFAAMLMQRGIIPLHASAVELPGGALVMMGRSGAGKSSLVAALAQRGLPVLADDVLGLAPRDDGPPLALPAFPALRLWEHSLRHLGSSPTKLPRVRSSIAKYYLPAPSFTQKALPIRFVVQLTNVDRPKPQIRPIPIPNRIECLSRYIFRKQFLRGLELQSLGFTTAASLARAVPFLRLTRPGHRTPPRELADLLLAELAAIEVAE